VEILHLVAIRGMDFQSIARTARFISDNSIAAIASNDNSWGIGIPIYNMNANVALSEKKYSYKNAAEKSGIGYNLVMAQMVMVLIKKQEHQVQLPLF
jgi:hypothetical protein